MNSNDVMKDLYEVVKSRKNEEIEGSYTCYLFEKGTDKILKKCGEECSEVIIAAKNWDALKKSGLSDIHDEVQGSKQDTVNEICDLFYHLFVLMAEQGIDLDEINQILSERSQKIGNLKKMHKSDRES